MDHKYVITVHKYHRLFRSRKYRKFHVAKFRCGVRTSGFLFFSFFSLLLVGWGEDGIDTNSNEPNAVICLRRTNKAQCVDSFK
ncbi:hypothetical protein BDV37DRAFT_207861 [Aspergillus pseudonomiae]|uniref:Uncharacterized protein n=1 Tax=Aspergillus pseudonomiae TaxID=1506151 RepID=A0A5N7DNY3_9EURO|nr:uncharacterized protein BDV37DRAFT_207861 [Aspergillus pseudonomiae]KAE8408035.1 hypothetical protein BDV37DRAFT_207861 [Aspergillus pseudonomiae]